MDDYNIGVAFTDDIYSWSTPELFDTSQDLINKYGERVINYITFSGSDDEIYQAIELKGDRE